MNKRYITAFVIALVISLLIVFDIYRCPFEYILGLSCPFCGITRAMTCLLNFDIAGSFHCHLFWPIIILGIIIHVLYEFNIIKKYKKQMKYLLYVFAVINFIYYIYRLTSGSDIVTFNFNESLIYRIIKLFIK